MSKFFALFVFIISISLSFYFVFAHVQSAILGKSTTSSFTLITTGDIGLGRYINFKTLQKKDLNYPFLKIADYLRNGDFTVINLEGPLINNCPIATSGFTFCGEDDLISGLIFAGVDAANLANNHTTNYGLAGLSETVQLLEENKLMPFGLQNQIQYTQVKGNTVALIGFVELGNNWVGLSNATSDNVKSTTKEAKSNADVVIAAFHWGPEYTRNPTQNMIDLAHLAIDSGADIVLGNHAHWIMHEEIYKGKPIIYAQGNTIFDQDWSQETKEGVIYTFTYKNGLFVKTDEKYTVIEENIQPRFVTDIEAQAILRKLRSD